MHLSRDFARQHDEAITAAVANALELGTLTERDKLLMQRKISNHGLGLRSMESNLEFLFLAGFMKTVRSIRHAFPNFLGALECTLEAESGYGLQLMDALEHLQQLPCQKLSALLPNTLRDVMKEDYVWPHDAIQRELDYLIAGEHDAYYDMTRIGDQQDKATNALHRHIDLPVDSKKRASSYSRRAPHLPCETTFRKGAARVCPQILS